jgi:hypothetical protein
VRLQLVHEKGQPWTNVTIEECEAPRRLVVSMKDDHGEWRIELTLTPTDDTTRAALCAAPERPEPGGRRRAGLGVLPRYAGSPCAKARCCRRSKITIRRRRHTTWKAHRRSARRKLDKSVSAQALASVELTRGHLSVEQDVPMPRRRAPYPAIELRTFELRLVSRSA